MRRSCLSVLLVTFLVLGFGLTAHAYEGTGLDLTGTEWQKSSQGEKLAFLYGASSVVAIEQLIADRQGTSPSPFVQAWGKAFNNLSWIELQQLVDKWYAEHPNDSGRQVFDVLWWEYMLPAKK